MSSFHICKAASASATLMYVNITPQLLSDTHFSPHAGVQGCSGNRVSAYSDTTAKYKSCVPDSINCTNMTANEEAKNNQTGW